MCGMRLKAISWAKVFVLVLTAGELCLGAVFKVATTGKPCSAGGLISANDDALDSGGVVQRLDGDKQAVWLSSSGSR